MPDEKSKANGGQVDEFLQSAPPGTPSWGLGIAYIIAVSLTPFVAVYLAVSPDIRQYLTGKQQIETATLEANKTLSLKNSESVLSIVATYTVQVAELSTTVGELQRDKRELEYKIDLLGKDVDSLKKLSDSCERELESCQSRCAK